MAGAGLFLGNTGHNPVMDASLGTTFDSQYAYLDNKNPWTPPDAPTVTMSTCGLLSRTYLYIYNQLPAFGGAPASHDAVSTHVATISPDLNGDIYFNMHATLLIYQMGGSEWDSWFGTLKPHLTATQVSGGDGDGSWSFIGPGHDSAVDSNVVGGRLYSTTMAVLCLVPDYAGLRLFE